ncbi:MAG: acyl carrier protein [Clostridia bacterium]
MTLERIEKIRKMIAEQLSVSEDKVLPESNLIADLEADSLDIVQMLIALEEEFAIEFEDDEIKALKTVSDVAKFIEGKQK